jgi:hypothetical protein
LLLLVLKLEGALICIIERNYFQPLFFRHALPPIFAFLQLVRLGLINGHLPWRAVVPMPFLPLLFVFSG